MSGERPTLGALDALWAGYSSKWRRLFSKNAIRELALRASFDLDVLAPERMANKIPKGTVPDCARCEDICCAGIENVVSLRLRDIAVLIDVQRTDLITKKKPRFPEALLKSRPMLEELAASELWRTLPVLRQIGDRRLCAALSPELKCTLYPSWPLSCERFPYTLSAVRKQVVWGKRCPDRKSGPEHVERSEQLFGAAVETFNERVRDAVLLGHAREELDRIGIGAFLTGPDEDPFEDLDPRAAGRLPLVR